MTDPEVMTCLPKPCPSCSVAGGSEPQDIPTSELELAEELRSTCDGQLGSPMMACHQSPVGREFLCAGWAARHGFDSTAVHMQVIARLDPEVAFGGARDGWPQLHGDFEQMIAKLRATTPDDDHRALMASSGSGGARGPDLPSVRAWSALRARGGLARDLATLSG